MSTALAAPPAPEVRGRQPERTFQRIHVHSVAWQDYVAIHRALEGHPTVRITYDRGELEIMVISPRHGFYQYCLARFVDVAAEEMELAIAPRGDMTFQREDLARALESDECYWIAHEQAMRGKMTWDPLLDPPPDLVIEVEITNSALNKMAIYAALRVPEVWRCEGSTLSVHVLRADGTYERVERSSTFPALALDEIGRFLQQLETDDYLSVVRAFRAWVRQQLGKQS